LHAIYVLISAGHAEKSCPENYYYWTTQNCSQNCLKALKRNCLSIINSWRPVVALHAWFPVIVLLCSRHNRPSPKPCYEKKLFRLLACFEYIVPSQNCIQCENWPHCTKHSRLPQVTPSFRTVSNCHDRRGAFFESCCISIQL
jgi:hypothetical protein